MNSGQAPDTKEEFSRKACPERSRRGAKDAKENYDSVNQSVDIRSSFKFDRLVELIINRCDISKI
jgi:hypothetical protein